MKKIILIVTVVCLIVALLTACGTKTPTEPENSGETSEDPSSAFVNMPNPIVSTDRDGFIEKLGFYMAEPENAADISYSVIGDTVGEMRFTKDGVDYTARMKDYPDPIEIGSEEAMEQYVALSGYYYTFKSIETCKVGYCTGEIIEYKNAAGDKTIQVVSWDDVVPGILYSLSVEGKNLDGFDISAVANELFVPMQGDVG